MNPPEAMSRRPDRKTSVWSARVSTLQTTALPVPLRIEQFEDREEQMAITEVKVPDIGDFKDIPVIEIMVKAGDTIKAEDPLISLESDKATMDVPAPAGGTVKEVKVKIGDRLSEGSVVL